MSFAALRTAEVGRVRQPPLREEIRVKGFGARAIEFGRFRLILHSRDLLADGVPIPIGNRALDVLLVLIEARGALVTKDEIMSRVWPGPFVEENTLQFQVSTLRKALGDDRAFIRTVSGRGYRFVAEIRTQAAGVEALPGRDVPLTAQLREVRPQTNLPAPIADLIGREAQLTEVANLVGAHRLVTLVGTGGIGKTRLGVELARRLLPGFTDGAWIVELAPLSDPELVLPAIAALFGISGGPSLLERLAAALTSKRVLLLLDNCEHVIDAMARVTEALLHAVAALRVVATSREPLRVRGESVYRVPPLTVPAPGAANTTQLLQASALRLFMARLGAAGPAMPPDPRMIAGIAKICRRLDGIPLAIELAAVRAVALGVEGLALRLDDQLTLLSDSCRTAPARHQTLRATFDWSYRLLSEAERVAMRRLSIFASEFTIDEASEVAADDDLAGSEIVHCLANLVMKSLVVPEIADTIPRYRLLGTMRGYAMEKLIEYDEAASVARRHTALVRHEQRQGKSSFCEQKEAKKLY